MTSSNINPFDLPGTPPKADFSGQAFFSSMETMGKAWADLMGSTGLKQGLSIAPPFNIEELEKRISELRLIENWLRMNLSVLNSTIQGLEMQHTSLATLQAFTKGTAADSSHTNEKVSHSVQTEASNASSHDVEPNCSATMQGSLQAWWTLLQQQFNHIAEATAAYQPSTVAEDITDTSFNSNPP